MSKAKIIPLFSNPDKKSINIKADLDIIFGENNHEDVKLFLSVLYNQINKSDVISFSIDAPPEHADLVKKNLQMFAEQYNKNHNEKVILAIDKSIKTLINKEK